MSTSDIEVRESLSALYCEHHNWLRGWLVKRLGCSEQAADLAQDTFVRTLSREQDIAELRRPRDYLSTIARGLVVDLFRRRALEQAYLKTLATLPEPVAISPETRSIILETLLEIDSVLNQLGLRTRRIFVMGQIEGLSYVEIARRLDVSVTTVKKHMVRALTHCLLLIEE